MPNSFNPGNTVTWISGFALARSRIGVSSTENIGFGRNLKTGIILDEVRSGEKVKDVIENLKLDLDKADQLSIRVAVKPRQHLSYLIIIPSKSGLGKPTLYFPSVKLLCPGTMEEKTETWRRMLNQEYWRKFFLTSDKWKAPGNGLVTASLEYRTNGK